MGVFSKKEQFVPNVKRNVFDLSFQNNLTMDFGKLYPFFCKEVLPGDSFKIDTAFGLRFLPLTFPLQTKMEAKVYYFYCRNRNVWDGWQQFITGVNGANGLPVFPTLSATSLKECCRTGRLGDYLGLPTNVIEEFSQNVGNGGTVKVYSAQGTLYVHKNDSAHTFTATLSQTAPAGIVSNVNATNLQVIRFWGIFNFPKAQFPTSSSTAGQKVKFVVSNCAALSNQPESNIFLNVSTSASSTSNYVNISDVHITPNAEQNTCGFEFTIGDNGGYPNSVSIWVDNGNGLPVNFIGDVNSMVVNQPNTVTVVSVNAPDWFENNDSYPTQVSALPFRHYESIYNAFFRDERNNPNPDVLDYNKYCRSTSSGVDNNAYNLYHINWEQDFLTSAMPSPQFGNAPLVGISSSGVASFDVDGKTYNVETVTSDDNDTITNVKLTDGLPDSVVRSAVNLATSGISINDFRAVNSFQRFLEANYRLGLKYKDQIKSHFDVDISYTTLDMPEFLGGCTEYVDIEQINQTSADTSDSPLASYAGQASLAKACKHSINKYCDEHGFIIGIVCVKPVPCYSQLLPKFFTKTQPLDYFFPEFGHIGFQPIPYREVCPLSAKLDGINPDSTFGYQRAWYDYLASTDEVHGNFRNLFRDFLLMRTFNTAPSLNPRFLTVYSSDINNVFSVDSVGDIPVDKILGQIHIDIKAKRPIPRFGIPSIE